MKWQIESKGKLSGNQFLLNVLAKSLEGDCFSVESSHSVDDFPKLFITESIIELTIDVLELFNGQFSSSLKVIQAEVGASSFFAEWVSLE